ncbi:hypothetical protein LINPERHAP1_LOCUS14010 [Linum perenne]
MGKDPNGMRRDSSVEEGSLRGCVVISPCGERSCGMCVDVVAGGGGVDNSLAPNNSPR